MSEEKIISPEDFQKVLKIKNMREQYLKNNNGELQNKKTKILKWLLVRDPNFKVLEMYPKNVYGKKQIPQYSWEYQFANTRTQIPSETRAEIDVLDINQSINLVCEICLSLINKNIHFCVFYAEGQRSPHIIIYDFFELRNLNPYQRLKARAKFWRWVIPFRFHLLDHSIWDDFHFVPIEFAPHWKYSTPFNLLFEYVPEVENAIST